MNRTLPALLLFGLFCASFCARVNAKDDAIWQNKPWSEFEGKGLAGGTILSHDFMLQSDVLKVANDAVSGTPGTKGAPKTGKTVNLLSVENPGITWTQHRLELQARCTDVDPDAMLEMVVQFGDGSEFFTRTNTDIGPMQRFSGNGRPRLIWLPFHNTSGKRIAKLSLNMIFAGTGTIYLGRPTLVQFGDRMPPLAGENITSLEVAGEKAVFTQRPWSELKGRSAEAELVANDPGLKGEALKLTSAATGARTVQFLEIDHPPLTTVNYRVDFQLRYENVENVAFLEMWTHFEDGGVYFSRTLAEAGPMAKLVGTSQARPASLPFYNTSGKRPVKLVFNLVFNGPGTVWLGRPTLTESGALLPAPPVKTDDSSVMDSGLRAEHVAGLLSGAAGTVLGLTGALIGLLTFIGRGRRVAFTLLALMLMAGVCSLAGGTLAYSRSQPDFIYYPLLLIGVIGTLLPLALFGTVRARYEDIELARLEAMDA
jgi:hypothetical protein